jgi:hypothetical protein
MNDWMASRRRYKLTHLLSETSSHQRHIDSIDAPRLPDRQTMVLKCQVHRSHGLLRCCPAKGNCERTSSLATRPYFYSTIYRWPDSLLR